MKKEIKVRLIEAIRSGKYNKIEGQLRNKHGHCANGVLCELAIQDQVPGVCRSTVDADSVRPVLCYSDGMNFWSYPPPAVLKWADMDMDECQKLARVNDGHDLDDPPGWDDVLEWLEYWS